MMIEFLEATEIGIFLGNISTAQSILQSNGRNIWKSEIRTVCGEQRRSKLCGKNYEIEVRWKFENIFLNITHNTHKNRLTRKLCSNRNSAIISDYRDLSMKTE